MTVEQHGPEVYVHAEALTACSKYASNKWNS
jgi:hypothetical protein